MIVATGPVHPVAEELLGPIVVDDDWRALLPEAEALIVRGGVFVTEDDLERAPRLRVIGRSGIGVDNVPVEAARARGIPVVVTPGAGARAVAEGALALLLAVVKRLPELAEAVQRGDWSARDRLELGDLDGATLGIVGYGRIGRELADLARGLGMHVLAYDPNVPEASVQLDVLFAESDAVSLHAPLTAETRGLVNAELLARARPGLVLINTSRGGLISSLDDLLAALERGHLSGVGLDVFEQEPPDPSHPLFAHPRVVVTPHALGMTRRARERIFREMAEAMAAVLHGKEPRREYLA
ncbi:MAG TPA: NAD(P)-dependent oxidoreductase [Gaiellaceae bacterium]|nr:NAD(P)-dependent oxidoreductase [Gaiellaceae bacterium]